MTLAQFAFATTFRLLFAAVTLSTAQDIAPAVPDEVGCVITNSSCPCAVQKLSGTCLRHQGNGACLMGECNDGYKCDCMAFEKCAMSQCSIYTTTNLAVSSETTEFSCELTPSAGRCVVFEEFMDTVDASDNAKTTSTVALIGTTTEMTEMINDQVEIMEEDDVLSQLDVEGAEDVTEEERAEVDNDAMEVTKAILEANVEATAALADMAEALEANLKAAEANRVARHKEQEAKAVEEEEKIERSKPENEEICDQCDVLKARVRTQRKERRDAAIAAGMWANKACGAMSRCQGRRNNVKKIKLSAREKRVRCVARARKILARLGKGTPS